MDLTLATFFPALCLLLLQSVLLAPSAPPRTVRTAPADSKRKAAEGGHWLKPRFHITPPYNWLNDPNGMFVHRSGTVHVMYQWNPARNAWGSPYWSHVVSKDFAYWKRLPPALVPDTWYDADGVFSGSATVMNHGDPLILYTGVSNFSVYGYYYQVQALAMPSDPEDPELMRWTKSARNPIVSKAPPGGNNSQFRDPTTAWAVPWRLLGDVDGRTAGDGPDEAWVTAVGAQVDCVGSAVLYASDDFVDWRYLGKLYTQQEITHRQGNSTGCDQYSSAGRAWECPDFFRVPMGSTDVLGDRTGHQHVQVLKYSDQVKGRHPFGKDWYVLSSEELDYGNKALLEGPGIFTPRVNGTRSVPRELDYGSVYASKAFRIRDDRMAWFGWVFETAPGCTEMCAKGTPATDQMGFQGALTLPREIGYDVASQELTFSPLPELKALRLSQLHHSNHVILPASVSNSGIPRDVRLSSEGSSSVGQRQMEVVAVFKLPSVGISGGEGGRKHLGAGEEAAQMEFHLGLKLLLNDRGNEVTVDLRGEAAASSDGRLLAKNLHISVDRSRSRSVAGGDPQDAFAVQGGPVALGSTDASRLELHVFIDHSLVEAYCQGGRGRVTSRIYPGVDRDSGSHHDSMWGLALFGGLASAAGGRGTSSPVVASVDVWELDSCWASSLQD